jgi:polysaccharide biosynthesis protein PslJ
LAYVASHSLKLAAAVLLIAALLAAMLAPLRLLPSAALLLTLLIPTGTLELPGYLSAAPVGLIPLVVWLARSSTANPPFAPTRLLGLGLAGWLIASEIFAPVHTYHGVLWLVAALVSVCAVAYRQPTKLDPDSVGRLFVGVSAVLAGIAVIEAFVLHSNPIFGHFYPADFQHWSVYRASATLGHPLTAGAVFAAALALTVANFLRRRGTVGVTLGLAFLLCGGIVATFSRGAVIASSVAILFLILINWTERRSTGRQLTLIAGVIVAGVIFSISLSSRNTAADRNSAELRSDVVTRTRAAMQGTSPLGAGPGESAAYRGSKHFADQGSIENTYAEMAISIGLIGLGLFATLMLSTIYATARYGYPGYAASLLALLVALGGYNGLEGGALPLTVLIALLSAASLRSVMIGRRASTAEEPGARTLRTPPAEIRDAAS